MFSHTFLTDMNSENTKKVVALWFSGEGVGVKWKHWPGMGRK